MKAILKRIERRQRQIALEIAQYEKEKYWLEKELNSLLERQRVADYVAAMQEWQ